MLNEPRFRIVRPRRFSLSGLTMKIDLSFFNNYVLVIITECLLTIYIDWDIVSFVVNCKRLFGQRQLRLQQTLVYDPEISDTDIPEVDRP